MLWLLIETKNRVNEYSDIATHAVVADTTDERNEEV